jgi:hypothetical protein
MLAGSFALQAAECDGLACARDSNPSRRAIRHRRSGWLDDIAGAAGAVADGGRTEIFAPLEIVRELLRPLVWETNHDAPAATSIFVARGNGGRCAVRCGTRGRAKLPCATGSRDRRLRARRRDRCSDAHDRSKNGRTAREAVLCGKSSRRLREYRHGPSREGPARWLHFAGRIRSPGDKSDTVRENALRSGQRLRSDFARRHLDDHSGGQSNHVGKVGR